MTPDRDVAGSTSGGAERTQDAPFNWVEWVGEIAARTQGIPRSRGARNALANARPVIEWEEEARRLHEPEADAWRAFWRALVLAPDLETFEALIRNESVPITRLDPAWVKRLGRRAT